MRTTKTISISLPPDMLKEAEKVAKEEGRTKSELVREALRQYMRAREWDDITAYGRARAREAGIGEEDVERLIDEYRAEQQQKRRKKVT